MEVESAALVYYMAVNYYFMNLLNYQQRIRKPRLKRRWWMIKMHRKRTMKTTEENMFADLLSEPSNQFQGFVRMSACDFEILLQKVEPIISKQKTRFRETISAKVRLAITLRYLATGDSFRSLHYLFKMSHQVISNIVRDCCAALNTALKDMVKLPANGYDWKQIEFNDIFPYCLAALDGKHVVMQCPIHSGSDYYNYKNSFSIVLLALVDRNYCFIFCDIGTRGRISDGGVFRNSLLFEKLQTNTINLPEPFFMGPFRKYDLSNQKKNHQNRFIR